MHQEQPICAAAAMTAIAFSVGSSAFHLATDCSKRRSVISTRRLCPITGSGSATAPNDRREYHSTTRYRRVRGGASGILLMSVISVVALESLCDREDEAGVSVRDMSVGAGRSSFPLVGSTGPRSGAPARLVGSAGSRRRGRAV